MKTNITVTKVKATIKRLGKIFKQFTCGKHDWTYLRASRGGRIVICSKCEKKSIQ